MGDEEHKLEAAGILEVIAGLSGKRGAGEYAEAIPTVIASFKVFSDGRRRLDSGFDHSATYRRNKTKLPDQFSESLDAEHKPYRIEKMWRRPLRSGVVKAAIRGLGKIPHRLS
jgi:hypothetical protein